MAEPGNPQAFFTEALTACDELENNRKALLDNSKRLKETEKTVSSLEKTMEKEKNDLVRKRRAELIAEYQKQLSQAEKALSEVREKRNRSREDGVKARIAGETAGLRSEVNALKDTRSQTVSLTGLPAFCKCDFYYTLFSPRGFREVLTAMLFFTLCLVLVPVLPTIGVEHIVWRVLLFILIDAVLIGLYMLIYQQSIGTNEQAVAKCRELTTSLKNNRKVIRKITSQIRKDKNDSCYDLSEYDAEIAKLTENKNAILAHRQEALSIFDSETAQNLRSEIDTRYRTKLTEAKGALSAYHAAQKGLTEKIAACELSLNSEFTPYVGKENMSHEKLEKMKELVENGTASGIQDAVIIVNQK